METCVELDLDNSRSTYFWTITKTVLQVLYFLLGHVKNYLARALNKVNSELKLKFHDFSTILCYLNSQRGYFVGRWISVSSTVVVRRDATSTSSTNESNIPE